MLTLRRIEENPILSPTPERDWEAQSSFNPCVIFDNGIYHMVYRALSPKISYYGSDLELSTIGYASSVDGIHFENRRQLITPEHDWEFYGCEDPRITKIDDTFYIFYTALSSFPFSASGIKVGVAVTKDFKTIDAKHFVTPFNAKAMSLFPEKVNGRYAAILTADTDQPPAKIALAYFDKIEEIWDQTYWENWYSYINDHTLHLQRDKKDHAEIGAPPIKTEQGWLLIYSYIKDYFTDMKDFRVEAATLQLTNPLSILARTDKALLIPEESYEKLGKVPNIVFPSGCLVRDELLSVYYGGADTVSCLATCNLPALLRDLTPEKQPGITSTNEQGTVMFKRFEENPILRPITTSSWGNRAVFNPAVLDEAGKIRILYRALSDKNVSSIGYAESIDGFHILKRSTEPIYSPKESFETNAEGTNFGCEDPRITLFDETIYMCYTAYDGHAKPMVAFTSLSREHFIHEEWQWKKAKLISPVGLDDKDACLFPKKIQGKYAFLHRLETGIWLDFVDDLEFTYGEVITGEAIIQPRPDKWDSQKIGIASPPLETPQGWLLFYHGIDKDNRYNVGAILMHPENPQNILARLDYPVLTPETEYERVGLVPNVVFPCGAVMRDGTILLYYGGADTVTAVASLSLTQLMDELLRYKS